MDMKKSKKLLGWLACAYWAMVIVVYLVAGRQFHVTAVSSDALSPSETVGEMVAGMEITQRIVVPADHVDAVSLMTSKYGREAEGAMQIVLADQQGTVLAEQMLDFSDMLENDYTTVRLDSPIDGLRGEALTLTLSAPEGRKGSSVTVYGGNMIHAGRFDIVKEIEEEDRYTVNGTASEAMLCVKLLGVNPISFYKTYWVIVSAAFIVAGLLCKKWWEEGRQGKNNPLVTLCTMCTRYQFLIKQLVARDFKTKYKRSVLGMAWSFLNPLLTMAVQYFVFSTLFKSDIPNYPVYLLSGIVFMNFFNEAVTMCMTSITNNAPLIKKVYMPKYIYPVSRVISSLVNFVLAIIPLFLVMMITHTAFRWSLLLLVFDILCLLGFIVGMGLLLTTTMTFFQDTQFLWGVASMMWMYVTPIFYPESIIPSQFLTLFHMNPMYQYITFARICIIDGVSPEPMAYLWCILSSLVVLVIGVFVFKKHQDKFVLYL